MASSQFACSTCGRRFRAAVHLRVHRGVHTRNHTHVEAAQSNTIAAEGVMATAVQLQNQEEEPPAETCIVCYDAVIDTGTDPCGHVCLCERCAGQLSACPLCRAAITIRFRAGRPAVAPPPHA